MITVTAFYKFIEISDTKELQKALRKFAKSRDLQGLTIVGSEGINGTVAGSAEAIAEWKVEVSAHVGDLSFKDSKAANQPFRRFFVKIRPEIVSLGDHSIQPARGRASHLSPEQWDTVIEEEDVVILDTRNTYETEIGMFAGALDPKLTKFQDFPDWVKQCGIPKNKKVLMYCTGGIRCEKASLAMQEQGFNEVYQLDGGILGYLAAKPEGKWRGECFVFDHRVAVDAKLLPSARYRLCPHCGDPGDVPVCCGYCKENGMICSKCSAVPDRLSCSKNCAHQLLLLRDRRRVRV